MSGIVKKYRRNGSIYFLASAQVGNRRPVKQAFDHIEEAQAWQRSKLAELHELLNTPAHDFTLKEVLVDFGVCYRKPIPPTLQSAIAAFLEISLKDLTAEAFQGLTLDESDRVFMERAIEYARKHLGVEIPDTQLEELVIGRLKLTYSVH
jgi:hypothetical protein